MIGGRMVSGTGGLADFVRGARLAPGGRSILALLSTASKGTVSRIVPFFSAGTVTSVPRGDADYVVTEHGVAALRDRTVEERAQALIGIAAPEFRAGLTASWAALPTTA
jgi:4-hydroxybutyrate CoA-transferase